jgi:hypothetical protein
MVWFFCLFGTTTMPTFSDSTHQVVLNSSIDFETRFRRGRGWIRVVIEWIRLYICMRSKAGDTIQNRQQSGLSKGEQNWKDSWILVWHIVHALSPPHFVEWFFVYYCQ